MKRLITTLSILALLAASGGQSTYAFVDSQKNKWDQLYEKGDRAWQQMHYKEAAAAFKSALSATNSDINKEMLTLEALAEVYREAKKLPEEEQTLISLTQLMEKKDQFPPIALAGAYLRLSCIEFFLGSHDKAERYAITATTLFTEACEPRCSNVAIALNNLAWIEFKTNKMEAAEAHFLKSLFALGQNQADNSLTYGLVAENLANLYRQTGNLKEAALWYQKSKDSICSVLEKDDPLVAEITRVCSKFEAYRAELERKNEPVREKSVKGKVIAQ